MGTAEGEAKYGGRRVAGSPLKGFKQGADTNRSARFSGHSALFFHECQVFEQGLHLGGNEESLNKNQAMGSHRGITML